MVTRVESARRGFFRSLAYNGAAVIAAMVVATAITIAARLDLVGFLAAYSIVYTAGAVSLMIAAVRGPIHATAAYPQQHAMSGLFRMLRARQLPSA